MIDPKSAESLGQWITGVVLVGGLAIVALVIAGFIRWMRRPNAGRRRRIIGIICSVLFIIGCPLFVGLNVWESWLVPELRAELGVRRSDDVAAITAIAYHPHDPIVAAGAANGTVSLWATTDSRAQRALSADLQSVTSVAFSPDGAYLAAVGQAGLRAWQLTDGHTVLLSDGSLRGVIAVAFASEGQSLLAIDRGGALYRWQFTDGTFRRVSMAADPATSAGQLRAAAFSADSASLATCRADGKVYLRAIADGRILQELPVEAMSSRRYCALAFSPDNRLLAVAIGSRDWLWQIDDGSLVRDQRRQLERYAGIAFSPDSQTLAVGVNQAIVLSSVRDDRRTQSASWFVGGWGGEYLIPIASIAYSPDGRTLVDGSSDGVVRIWKARRPIR